MSEPAMELGLAEGPMLHLAGFEGPLDRLLDLAGRGGIDLGSISARALAEQCAAALETLAAQAPLERRAGWLVIAARLVLLRSRLLLPESLPDEAAAPEEDAAARPMATPAEIRAAADWFMRRPQLGRDVFARPRPEVPPAGGYVALMEACLSVLEHETEGGPPSAAPIMIPDLWRAADAMARIRRLLHAHPEGGPLEAFLPQLPRAGPDREMQARGAVSATFLAGLEMAKEGSLGLEQESSVSSIWLLRPPSSDSGAETAERL